MHAVLTSERALRHVLEAAAVLIIVGVLGFIFLRVQEGLLLQQQVAVQEVRIQQLETAVAKLHRVADLNTINLANTQGFVFGTVAEDLRALREQPRQVVQVALPAWQIRRDNEMQARLVRLEMWRLSLQKEPE